MHCHLSLDLPLGPWFYLHEPEFAGGVECCGCG